MKIFCGRSTVALQTPLSLDEFWARLHASADAEKRSLSWSGYAGSNPILWKFDGNFLRLQRRIYYRNFSRRFFYSHVTPSLNGTLIEGEFRMRPFAKLCVRLWVTFCLLIVIIALFIPGESSRKLVVVITSFGLIAWMALLMKFGQRLGRKDEKYIANFLKNGFDAGDFEAVE